MIVTHRDGEDWALRRHKLHGCVPPPFRTWFVPFRRTTRNKTCTTSPVWMLQHAHEAHYRYVDWLATTHGVRTLHLNIFDEDDAKLWEQLISFLDGDAVRCRPAPQWPHPL